MTEQRFQAHAPAGGSAKPFPERIGVRDFYHGFAEQIAAYERFPFAIVVGPIAPIVPGHTHTFFEIDLVLSGGGRGLTEGKFTSLRPGDMVLGNQFEFHEIRSQKPMSMCSIKFGSELLSGGDCAGAENLRLTTPFIAGCGRFRHRFRPDPEGSEGFATLTRALQEEYFSKKAYREQAILSLLQALLIRIRRAFDIYCRSKGIEVSEASWPLVHRIMRYVDTHALADVYIRDLPKLFSMSQQRLGRVFREATGHSIKHYLTARRIAAAQQRLIFSREPVGEIAMESGFSTMGAFSRAFHAVHGISPLRYRECRRQK